MADPQALVQERLAANNRWGLLGNQGCILGLDLGSYGLRASLINLNTHTYYAIQREEEPKDAEGIVSGAIELARELLNQHGIGYEQIVRIGAGFAGPVDASRGVVLLSPRMPGWEQYPLREVIEKEFGATTLLDNDANLIALAEATFGVGRNLQHLFYLHLSSGVGGGLVLNQRLYHGATTTAGEIGHAVVGAVDPIWNNQSPGTLEQHLSINGLLRRASTLGLQTDLLRDIFGDDPIAKQVVSEAVNLLAVQLCQIVALLDPQMIVIGGVVARNGGEPFINAIQKRMRDFMTALVDRSVPITQSVLGFESVAIGGLSLALESMTD